MEQEGGKEKTAITKAQSRKKPGWNQRAKRIPARLEHSREGGVWQEAREEGLPHLQSLLASAAVLEFMTGANKNPGRSFKQGDGFNVNQLFQKVILAKLPKTDCGEKERSWETVQKDISPVR